MAALNKVDIQGKAWIDQIFDGRNKSYGAYVLRRNAVINTLLGVGLAITVTVLVLLVPRALALIISNHPELIIVDHVSLSPPPVVDAQLQKPRIMKVDAPKVLATKAKITEPLIVSNETRIRPQDITAPISEKVNITATGNTSLSTPDEGIEGPPESPSLSVTAGEKENEPRVFVEQMPQYPGGEAALLRELGKYLNSHYPAAAVENNIVGRVTVRFVVERDGSVSDIEIIGGKELGGGLPEVAGQAIKILRHFAPGRQNGNTVRVFYSVPLNFQLESSN